MADHRKGQALLSFSTGILMVILEVGLANLMTKSFFFYVLVFLLGIVASLALTFYFQSFHPAFIMTGTILFSIAVVLGAGYLGEGMIWTNDTFLLIGINIFSILSGCMSAHFMQKTDRIKGFSSFFKKDCILVGIYLLLVLFLRPGVGISMHKANFIPFHTISLSITQDPFMGRSHIALLASIAIFIPIGFFLTIFMKKINIGYQFLIALGGSVLSELLQYLFARGVADIDDVILNMAGFFTGVFTYWVLNRAYQEYQKKKDAYFISV